MSLCPAAGQVFQIICVRIRKAAGRLPWRSGNRYRLPAGDPGSIPLGVACHRVLFTLFYFSKKQSHCRTQSILKNLSGCRTCSHSEKQNVKQTTYRNNSSNGWPTNPERYSGSNKQHSNSFQKTTRVLFSFNNCTIQSQQIEDVYASKTKLVVKIVAQRGSARRRAGQISKPRTSQRKIVF